MFPDLLFPRKIKRQVFYSQKHVDIAKDLAKAEPEYYTTAEAMEKYNLTRDQLYHYVKWHHISKVQEGKYIKISRKELDDLLAPPSDLMLFTGYPVVNFKITTSPGIHLFILLSPQ